MRAVIIDDDLFYGEFLARILANYGITVIKIFQTVEELRVSRIKAEVYFVDYHLKEENGSSALNYLEKHQSEAGVVLMSYNDYAPDLINSKNFLWFIPKSKLKYLRFRIFEMKKVILKRQEKIQTLKNLSYTIPVLIAFILYSISYLQ